MHSYGDVAVRATKLMMQGRYRTPEEAWAAAARQVFPTSVASQKKGCPKGAYLGLCDEGLVRGVAPGQSTSSRDNKEYALNAVRLLVQDPTLADRGLDDGGAANLWRRVTRGRDVQPNSQMEVVLALWNADLIARA